MTMVAELNRLANGGTAYPDEDNMVGPDLAANLWAGTTDMALVGALNVKAGNTTPDAYLDLQGVSNQLAGTTGYGVDYALSLIAS